MYIYEDKIAQFTGAVLNNKRLTVDEQVVIDSIKEGHKRKFRILCFGMKGNFSFDANVKRYNELLRKHESLRKRYLYREYEYPISVTLTHKDITIPILDIRTKSIVEKKRIIENIAAASARELYNPEEDSILKINICIIGDDRAVIIFKVYEHFGLPMTPFDMRRFIFFNMKMDSESIVDISVEKLIERNEAEDELICKYWLGQLEGVNRPTRIPFTSEDNAQSASSLYSVNYAISEENIKKLSDYCKKQDVTTDTALLYEYAEMFGQYSGAKKVLIGLRKKGTIMGIMPLAIDIDSGAEISYKDIAKRCDEFVKYSECDFKKAMNRAGIVTPEYFDVCLEFEQKDTETTDNKTYIAIDPDNFSPKLEISVLTDNGRIGIRYTYDSSCLSEQAVSAIHDAMLGQLVSRIDKSAVFSWKEYISDTKSQEEKLRKLDIAQKALYLKQGEFLMLKDANAVIDISSHSTVGNYIVEDVVYEAGRAVKNVGILVAGHLEERYIDLEGMTKTVSVYKPGYVLGLESIAHTGTCAFSYVAADDVKVIWVPAEAIESALNSAEDKSEMMDSYVALLKKSLKETDRLKKLWALE